MEYGTLEEKKALAARSGWFCGGAILLSLSSGFLIGLLTGSGRTQDAGAMSPLFLGVVAISAVLWLTGCCYYARSKGYSGFVGILGILTLIGLIVLVVLPDNWKKALQNAPVPMAPTDLTNYPR